MAKQRQPEHPQIRLKLIEACLHAGLYEQAYEDLRQVEDNATQLLAKDWFRLGVLQHQFNLEQQALNSFTSAVRLVPESLEFVYTLALTQKNCGLLEEAKRNLEFVIARQPVHVDARHALTLIQKSTPDNKPHNELSALLPQCSINEQIKLRFSLAKCHEDLGHFDDAFAQMQQANQAKRQRTAYKVDNDIALMQTLQTYFCKQPQSVSSLKSSRPIFIVGLPRSGSTLTERILTQPDNVGSAGELLHFSAILSRLTMEEFGLSADRESFVHHSTQVCPNKLGQAYLASTDALTRNHQYLVDKMPVNFLNVGAILRALPNAKIIHMQRKPIDNVLAIYKTLFEQAYPYAYDLAEIARYLAAERELMHCFRQQFSRQIYSINYEELVTNPETVAAGLFEFCQLEFKTEYLDVAKNNSAAATASAAQVRKGIHQSSVENWRNYEKYLNPAIEVLREHQLFSTS